MSVENPRASTLLAALLPAHVAAFETREPIDPATLDPQEARYVTHAAPKRAAEFAAGRACARTALAALGISGFALRPGPNREPAWPAGVVGSITHTAGYCGAAVARQSQLLCLGIDAERRGRVHRRLWHRITTKAERVWLEGLPHERASDMAAVIFSAKEAFFKAQFPLTREWLAFADVSVSAEAGSVRFSASRTLAIEALVPGAWTGRYAFDGDLVVAGVAYAPHTPPASDCGSSLGRM
ncbi:MAG: 4'-phosphopantetheinyl transferase family protein [Steroidobacteraceae bacterium]